MDFPAFVPSSRNYSLGDYAVRVFRSQSGAESRILYGDTRFGAGLELQYQNIDDKIAQTFTGHYDSVKGTFNSFNLPTSILAGWTGSPQLLNVGYKNQRTTTATYTSQDGIVLIEQPGKTRFQFDPVSKKVTGTLLEEEATNLLGFSETFDSSVWSVNKRADLSESSGTLSPDGANFSKGLSFTSTDTRTGILSAKVTLDSPGLYSFSIYFKYISKFFPVTLSCVKADDFKGIATFDFLAETSATKSGICTFAGFERLAEDWYRLKATFNVPIAISPVFALQALFGVGSVWGGQLEFGGSVTSYIPTSDQDAVTRSADKLLPIGSWRYSEPPTITNIRPGTSSVSVRLVSVV